MTVDYKYTGKPLPAGEIFDLTRSGQSSIPTLNISGMKMREGYQTLIKDDNNSLFTAQSNYGSHGILGPTLEQRDPIGLVFNSDTAIKLDFTAVKNSPQKTTLPQINFVDHSSQYLGQPSAAVLGTLLDPSTPAFTLNTNTIVPLAVPTAGPVTNIGDIATRVRTERKTNDMTQQELADYAGVGRRFIQDLEKGQKSSLEFGKVLDVCETLGIELQMKAK